MTRLYKDNAVSVITQATIGTDGSFSCEMANGERFPNITTTGDTFILVLERLGEHPIYDNQRYKVEITEKNGAVLTGRVLEGDVSSAVSLNTQSGYYGYLTADETFYRQALKYRGDAPATNTSYKQGDVVNISGVLYFCITDGRYTSAEIPTDSGWATLRGERGEQGQQGQQGQRGQQGVAGTDGTDGADGTDGTDGTDGNSVDALYRRSATAPSTPSGGTASNGVITTAPTGWSTNSNLTGTDPMYICIATITANNTITYDVPVRLTGERGQAGTGGGTGAGGNAVIWNIDNTDIAYSRFSHPNNITNFRIAMTQTGATSDVGTILNFQLTHEITDNTRDLKAEILLNGENDARVRWDNPIGGGLEDVRRRDLVRYAIYTVWRAGSFWQIIGGTRQIRTENWAQIGNPDNIPTSKIPNLAASKITSGELTTARIKAGGTDGQVLKRTGSGHAWQDESGGGTPGTDGTDGNSVDAVYRRSATAPATPSGGTASGGQITTAPTDWSTSSNLTGDDDLYISVATITPANTITYDAPIKLTGQQGQAGMHGAAGGGAIEKIGEYTKPSTVNANLLATGITYPDSDFMIVRVDLVESTTQRPFPSINWLVLDWVDGLPSTTAGTTQSNSNTISVGLTIPSGASQNIFTDLNLGKTASNEILLSFTTDGTLPISQSTKFTFYKYIPSHQEGAHVLANVEGGRLPTTDIAVRFSYNDTQTFTEADFTGTKSSTGTTGLLTVGTITETAGRYLGLWIAGDPDITGITIGNIIATEYISFFPASLKQSLTVDGVAGTYYPTNQVFFPNTFSGQPITTYVAGDKVITDRDIQFPDDSGDVEDAGAKDYDSTNDISKRLTWTGNDLQKTTATNIPKSATFSEVSVGGNIGGSFTWRGFFTITPASPVLNGLYYNTDSDDLFLGIQDGGDIVLTILRHHDSRIADVNLISDSIFSSEANALASTDLTANGQRVMFRDSGTNGFYVVSDFVAARTDYARKTIYPQIMEGTPAELNPIAGGETVSTAHGLGGYPDYFKAYVECITADAGYSVGDRIDFYGEGDATISYDDTNTYIATRNRTNGWRPFHKTNPQGYAVTVYARWKFVVVPYKYVL